MITVNATGSVTINGDPEFQQKVLSELQAIRSVLEKGDIMSAVVLGRLNLLVTRLQAALDKITTGGDPNGLSADEVSQIEIPLQTATEKAEAKVPK